MWSLGRGIRAGLWDVILKLDLSQIINKKYGIIKCTRSAGPPTPEEKEVVKLSP
jgi:hypothetical protein